MSFYPQMRNMRALQIYRELGGFPEYYHIDLPAEGSGFTLVFGEDFVRLGA